MRVEMAMTLAIHHIAINARDPALIANLYARAVGFSDVDVPGPCRWIAGPNGFVALFEATDAPAGSPCVCDPGIGHFCIQSAADAGTWDRLSAAGIMFNAAPAGLGTGVLYAYGRDPEGNLIETEGVTDADATTPPWIAHVALVSSNLERLADFYERLVGRARHSEGTFANPAFKQVTGFDDVEVSAKWIMADNMILEMWCYNNPPTTGVRSVPADAAGYRHIGFACDNLGQEMRRLAKAGIAIDPVPTFAGLLAVAGTDPDGNRFIIVETPPDAHPLSFATLSAPDTVFGRSKALLQEGNDF